MITDWRNADTAALTALWNRFHPQRYQIDEAIFRLNTIENPNFDWGASLIDIDVEDEVRAFVVIKKPPAVHHKVRDPDAMHLSALAFSEPLHGVELLGQAKRVLRERGVQKVLFGQESRHFWPGVPTDFQRLVDFLTIEGFEFSGDHFDVERDLAEYELQKPLPVDAEFRVLEPGDLESLKLFLATSFPGRWEYDMLWKVAQEGDSNFLMVCVKSREVVGFAAIQDPTTQFPIGGAIWRTDLGHNWGALGPIGVAESVRGGGYGGAMLAAGLLELQRRGVRRCIIDWTTLDDFYGKHGFEIARRYQNATLML